MRILSCGAMFALALALAACGGAPPKPAATKAALVAAGDVNPDPTGRPSPVVVRLYQLKEEGAFNNAEFFALNDKEQETLGPSLVAREEYPLNPGDTRNLELQFPPEVQYLGVSAGYRDILNSKWKALLPVGKGHPAKKLTISVEKSAVAITAGK